MRVSSTDMQNNFGKYLKFAEAGEEIIVTKNGKDVAKLTAFTGEDDDPFLKEEAARYESGDWVTYEEFLELTETSEQLFELIDGAVYNLASPSYKHQHAVNELHGTFYLWFKGKPCTPLTSPFDITLKKSKTNICVVQPDLVVICGKDQINQRGKYMGTPELAVEVLSPSTRSKDLIRKLDLYRKCGVKEYWIVDPMKEQVTVFTLTDGEIADVAYYSKSGDPYALSQLYEGLRVSMQDLFA
ncbi:type II toxin-antitoxin system prevent-host-death family antitoxin [Paenibacillus macerans]|uniref:Prevent-host-death family protein n=1 Tax=Paenibacillus macerans TaxID=44252 RepID=A0A090ZDI6_PAEMA|nr:type II toxin-antitoxin system prevent-host-death family antitoxin [Paenibacillus macerans]KFN08280.1 prevent-host-death family protein [Paenibacillus macerans]MCY7557568.1 type II toxin-antitoxin system prevent-host-death family antitoxin [Paenibacillus macerans]MEC0154554.1 type II toxin-antitoxin system prevent-host-death family antitoxin [Paenibacillus macerans]SUA83791.1 prevent-host-death family protein [Paenibacillus macerans]